MRISEALGVYLLQLEADGRSGHTRRNYERHIRLLVRVIGDVDIECVTTGELARFMVSPPVTRCADGSAKQQTSLNCLRSTLRTWFAWARDAGMIQSNPAKLLRRAMCGSAPPRGLSEDEQRMLLDVLANAKGWAAERDSMLVGLMLATGIRLASALALSVEDIDLSRGEILLRSTKGNAPRRVFLGAAIRGRLSIYMEGTNSGSLFPSRQGQALCARQAQRRLCDWMALAGIGHGTAHSLRHAFAMRIYRETRDLLLVQRALGHRSVSSTVAYVRCDDAALRAALG